jgi:hypothetical protein
MVGLKDGPHAVATQRGLTLLCFRNAAVLTLECDCWQPNLELANGEDELFD